MDHPTYTAPHSPRHPAPPNTTLTPSHPTHEPPTRPTPTLPPQNVLMGEGGVLQIADLGISEVLHHVFTDVLVGAGQGGLSLP